MFDSTMQDRIAKLVDVKLNERRKLFPVELGQIDSQAVSRGMFHSSVRVHQILQAYERELEVRAILAWESMVRVHRILGQHATGTLREDLKVEVRRYIETEKSELVASLNERIGKSGISLIVSLDEPNTAVLRKHDIEIDLYVDSLSTADGETRPVTQTYNFYGAVGAVQSGVNASANVVQNLGPDDKAALVEAIRQVRDAISDSHTAGEQQQRELLEIANECAAQLVASSPNNTKLLTMFNVLGTAIQSVASAQPAYQALKLAVLPLGITLP